MSSKLSVEDVLAHLETRAVFHREQEALHAQQETHHQEQKVFHAAELERVLASLEAFRTVATQAVDLARPLAAAAAATVEEEKLPPPGRLMVSRLLRLTVATSNLPEPFSPTAVAAEANRRFAQRLKKPIGSRTASDVLRRLVGEGELQVAREGKAFHEALYAKRRPGS
jgi:hypothetical protein